MSDLKDKIKALSDNKKRVLLIVICIVSLLFLIISESNENEGTSQQTIKTQTSPDEYIKTTEKELESILSQVEGAGKVHVMITLESCYENVYANSYSSKSKNNGDGTSDDVTEELVVIKNSDGENGVVIKVYEPVIKGVAVVAQGADNIKVKSAITETVCALFDISSAKVSVTKGYKE